MFCELDQVWLAHFHIDRLQHGTPCVPTYSLCFQRSLTSFHKEILDFLKTQSFNSRYLVSVTLTILKTGLVLFIPEQNFIT